MLLAEQSSESAPSSLLLRLDRRFGLAEASALQRTLAEVAPGSRLTFDFTAVREFQDAAVASLAQALRRFGPTTEVLGLSRHHWRMLRYFGVEYEETNRTLDTGT